MPARLPKLRSDGSFTVVVVYHLAAESLLTEEVVAAWIEDWLGREGTWVREWSSGEVDSLPFLGEFTRLPQIAEITPDSLTLRFEGRPGSKWWKDWWVRFTSALVQEFSSKITGVKSVRNGDDAEPLEITE